MREIPGNYRVINHSVLLMGDCPPAPASKKETLMETVIAHEQMSQQKHLNNLLILSRATKGKITPDHKTKVRHCVCNTVRHMIGIQKNKES